MSLVAPSGCTLARGAVLGAVPLTVLGAGRVHKRASPRTWSKTPGKLWKVGETADGGARENPVFPPFLRLAAASIRRCCTCVPGGFDQMRRTARGQKPRASYGKWAKPLTEGHGKTQCFRHFSVSLRPRSGDAAPACPGFLSRCGGGGWPGGAGSASTPPAPATSTGTASAPS